MLDPNFFKTRRLNLKFFPCRSKLKYLSLFLMCGLHLYTMLNGIIFFTCTGTVLFSCSFLVLFALEKASNYHCSFLQTSFFFIQKPVNFSLRLVGGIRFFAIFHPQLIYYQLKSPSKRLPIFSTYRRYRALSFCFFTFSRRARRIFAQ